MYYERERNWNHWNSQWSRAGREEGRDGGMKKKKKKLSAMKFFFYSNLSEKLMRTLDAY